MFLKYAKHKTSLAKAQSFSIERFVLPGRCVGTLLCCSAEAVTQATYGTNATHTCGVLLGTFSVAWQLDLCYFDMWVTGVTFLCCEYRGRTAEELMTTTSTTDRSCQPPSPDNMPCALPWERSVVYPTVVYHVACAPGMR